MKEIQAVQHRNYSKIRWKKVKFPVCQSITINVWRKHGRTAPCHKLNYFTPFPEGGPWNQSLPLPWIKHLVFQTEVNARLPTQSVRNPPSHFGYETRTMGNISPLRIHCMHFLKSPCAENQSTAEPDYEFVQI